jgi:hypothetical protein
MKPFNFNNLSAFLMYLLLAVIVISCDEDDPAKDETFGSDVFSILKVSEGDNTVEDGEVGLSAYGLSLEIVFTHAVSTSALESNLTVSDNATFSIAYDESNSIATLTFEPLDYETAYTLSLPAGAYGTDGESLNEDYSLTFTTKAFVTPNVFLAVDNSAPEEGQTSVITISLSESTTEDVTVNLAFGGSAGAEDYEASATAGTIPVGSTSTTVTITMTDDADVEGTEVLEVTIESITNGQESSTQSLAISIVDNDVATSLMLKGVMAIEWSTQPSGNSGKAIHLKATADIADLSVYSIGVANNGGGTDSIEYTFPAISVNNGDDILLAREDASLSTYFGTCAAEFEHVIQTDAMTQNGDDAIELYSGTSVIETYGDADVDGTDQPWEYAGSWGYKLGDTWIYGGVDNAAGSTTTQDSDCTYPLCLNPLQLQGIMSFEADPSNSGSTDRERAIHLRANQDIADLSVYGIGIPNNGGGTDGREMDLPAISVSEGDHILFIRDEDFETIATYLGSCIDQFDHLAQDGGINFNGDDGVELYRDTEVIEVYGSVQDDGTGLFWEYTGSWAFKEFGDVYTYGGVNCAEFAATNASSECPYAFCQ